MLELQDTAITQTIQSRLLSDFRTSGQQLHVSVSNGEIIITGYCDDENHKTAALNIASGVWGVKKIVDQIRVREPAAFI